MHCTFRFGFKASNNEAKDEALISGLNLTKEIKVNLWRFLVIPSSSSFRSQTNIRCEVRKWRPTSKNPRISLVL